MARRKLTTEEWIDKVLEKYPENGKKYDYSLVDYQHSQTKVKIICLTCKEVFDQTPNSHLSQGTGCPLCGMSSGMRAIWQYLKNLGINFDHRVRLKQLPGHIFNFYLPDHKIIIQYDTRHHYEYPNFVHKTEEEAQALWDKDKEKDQWCLDHDVKMERIRWDEDITSRLSEILR